MYNYYLDITGSCLVQTPVITAKLSEGGSIGKDTVLTLSVTNTDDHSITYDASVDGFDSSIVSLTSVNPQSITLQSGETGYVTVKFDSLGAGELDFRLKLTDSDENVFTKSLGGITIEDSSSNVFDFSFDNDMFLYGLVGVLVLFILVLFISVIVASKKQKPIRRE